MFPVWHSRAAVAAVLREGAVHLTAGDARREVLDGLARAVAEMLELQPVATESAPAPSVPRLVCVEGLDGTGKSTVCSTLREDPRCVGLLTTPPASIAKWRKQFDDCGSERLRRAFYFAGNYLAWDEAVGEWHSGGGGDGARTVSSNNLFFVMDRFFMSTVAYAVATAVSRADGSVALPGPGDAVFHWPEDLVHPAVIVLLSAEERVRHARVVQRATQGGPEMTAEEKALLLAAPQQQQSSQQTAPTLAVQVMQCLRHMCEHNRTFVSFAEVNTTFGGEAATVEQARKALDTNLQI